MASYEEEELPHDPSEETLTIEARFQPLLTETMTKSKDGFLGVSSTGGATDDKTTDNKTLAPEDRPVPSSSGLSASLMCPRYSRSRACFPVQSGGGAGGSCISNSSLPREVGSAS